MVIFYKFVKIIKRFRTQVSINFYPVLKLYIHSCYICERFLCATKKKFYTCYFSSERIKNLPSKAISMQSVVRRISGKQVRSFCGLNIAGNIDISPSI